MPRPAADPATHARALAALQAGAQAAWQALVPYEPDLTVEVVPSLDSTNAELLRRARSAGGPVTLLAAVEQTAGRGRAGRRWVTLPGASLAFSLGLALKPTDWSGLSLVVGVALAQALPPGVRLKWPNDLWWQGRKLGGILIETAIAPHGRYAVIGVGLNLATPALPPDAPLQAIPPTGLDDVCSATGTPQRDPGGWLARLAPALLHAVRRFEADGFAPWRAQFGALDALAGQRVHTSDGLEGIAEGVDDDGALRLRTPHGVVRVQAGEVSVRPC